MEVNAGSQWKSNEINWASQKSMGYVCAQACPHVWFSNSENLQQCLFELAAVLSRLSQVHWSPYPSNFLKILEHQWNSMDVHGNPWVPCAHMSFSRHFYTWSTIGRSWDHPRKLLDEIYLMECVLMGGRTIPGPNIHINLWTSCFPRFGLIAEWIFYDFGADIVYPIPTDEIYPVSGIKMVFVLMQVTASCCASPCCWQI